MKTTVLCSDCGEEFDIEGRYDFDVEAQVTCPHCKFRASKWTFDYMKETNEEE